jgi:hypothetical protein
MDLVTSLFSCLSLAYLFNDELMVAQHCRYLPEEMRDPTTFKCLFLDLSIRFCDIYNMFFIILSLLCLI